MLVTTWAILACLGSFWYCSQIVRWIMKQPRGTPDMQIIADYIKEGANSYLKTQYVTIGYIAMGVATALIIIYIFRGEQSSEVSPFVLAIVTAISFLIGAFCSALAGYTGTFLLKKTNII